MRSLKIYSTILATVLFVFFGVIYWPVLGKLKNESLTHSAEEDLEVANLQLAENHFKKAEYDQVSELISYHQDSISARSDIGEEWLNLLVLLSEKTFDIPQLVLINEYHPDALAKNEKASLLVAESLVMHENNESYELLREKWRGKESKLQPWAILDADHLLLQGRYSEGAKLLETKLEGRDEIARLTRLSLLNVAENPEKALDYLSEAQKLDPSDLDVFLYQTKILEKLKKNKEALKVYTNAILKNPKSIFMQDQLADFYIRLGKYPEAIKTWEKALSTTLKDDDYIQGEAFVKLYFFDRILHGQKNDWKKYIPLNTPLKPLISYLLNLKNDEFVNSEAFKSLPHHEEYSDQIQVVYWLSLLDALKQNDQEKALSMILNSPFKEDSVDKSLEMNLLQAIHFQKTGSLLDVSMQEFAATEHPLLNGLNGRQALTEDIQALIKSDEIFSSILLANGWTDAALNLHKMEVIPDHFPSWLKMEISLAMRKNQGDEAALKFASKQSQDAKLNLVAQEMTARIALKNGNMEFATRIYESLKDSSFEAKSFLARKAFKESDFQAAEKLTLELLQKYPDNRMLIDNLNKIQAKKSA